MTQFSLFGAEALDPVVGDLEGLLLAGGRWVRRAGGARLSVVVDAPWRAAELTAQFARRGLPAEVVGASDGWSVRSEFAEVLAARAASWLRGATEAPPPGFALTAGGLRLWTVATGGATDAGYLLSTARADEVVHLAGGAALSALGMPATSLGGRGGRGWRITSARRLWRFAELVGPPPAGAGSDWPVVR